MKTKSDYDTSKELSEIDSKSLLDVPHHLLFSFYVLQYLSARDSKIKLLYTLNVFRAIQKRLTLDLREVGTRDRVMGDCNIAPPTENA